MRATSATTPLILLLLATFDFAASVHARSHNSCNLRLNLWAHTPRALQRGWLFVVYIKVKAPKYNATTLGR